jgi:hypothetical protein
MQNYIPYEADFKLFVNNTVKLNSDNSDYLAIKRISSIYKQDLDSQIGNFMFVLFSLGAKEENMGVFKLPDDAIDKIDWDEKR